MKHKEPADPFPVGWMVRWYACVVVFGVIYYFVGLEILR
jgi:hypothetical protein